MSVAECFILGLFIFLGGMSAAAGVFNFEWYFRTGGAMMFVKWLGRTGARVFYVLLGGGLIACGVTGFVCWG